MDIVELRDRLKKQIPFVPEMAIVLGSGFGVLAECPEAQQGCVIPFAELPGFPAQTTEGHAGRMVFCEIEGRKVLLQAGRFHFYEGHTMALLTAPMRLYGRLGIPMVLLTNAAGAINPDFQVGELMAITDHINLMGANPLCGPNQPPGPRFPDLSETYDAKLVAAWQQAAHQTGQRLREGVYLAISGPSYETPAEIRAFRTLGADAVGMSTVPEAIVARHEGMRVAAISCLTNMAAGISAQPLTHNAILDAGKAATAKFELLLRAFLKL